MINAEKRYLEAKAAIDAAKKELAEAKAELLGEHGLKACRACTEDEAALYERGKIETDKLKISHYSKSSTAWDAKSLEELSETVPAILEARRTNYRIEARISIKKADK
jgi:hypothetical protein